MPLRVLELIKPHASPVTLTSEETRESDEEAAMASPHQRPIEEGVCGCLAGVVSLDRIGSVAVINQ